MGKAKRNRSASSRHSSNGSAANGAGATAPLGESSRDLSSEARMNPQAQRAANLGSMLIHVGIVWLVVGILVKVGNNARDGETAADIGGASDPSSPNGTLIDGNEKSAGRTKLASVSATATATATAMVTAGGPPPAKSATSSIADVFSVPKETLGSMGSYPDPFGITDEMRRGFHPVVKFPEVWADDNAVADDAAVVNGDAIEPNQREMGKATKGGRWRPPWRRKGLTKILDYIIIDFQATSGASQLVDPARAVDVARERRRSGFRGEYGVGRYDEDRSHLYSSAMFKDESRDIDGYQGARTVHVGVDLGGPVGTKVYAFEEGVIHSAGYNPDLGDYGHVIVVEHALPSISLNGEGLDASKENIGETDSVGDNSAIKVWALYGHLDAKSVRGKVPGKRVRKGQVLGKIGDVHENGGWYYPHVHFQLSAKEPETHDMPGAVALADRPRALIHYPDPRIVLGALY